MWCVGDSVLLGLSCRCWHNRAKPIALKTHQRPAKSLFRYGFDGIRQAVLNAVDMGEQFEQILSLLWKALSLPKTLLQPRYST